MKFGIPERVTANLAGELSGRDSEFVLHAKRLNVDLKWVEKAHHVQNHRAEREIGILKQRWRRRMSESAIPARLWDYGLVYESELLTRLVQGSSERTGFELVTGQTPDISE